MPPGAAVTVTLALLLAAVHVFAGRLHVFDRLARSAALGAGGNSLLLLAV